jgi:hypothetical protein
MYLRSIRGGLDGFGIAPERALHRGGLPGTMSMPDRPAMRTIMPSANSRPTARSQEDFRQRCGDRRHFTRLMPSFMRLLSIIMETWKG